MADMLNEWDEEETETPEPKPKNGLRAQFEAALARQKELEQELATLRQERRARTLHEKLSAAGVNPKIAKFIPQEVDGDEAIGSWLAENADVFGLQVNTGEPQKPVGATPEQITATRGLQNLSNAAVNPSKLNDINSRIATAKDLNEIQALIREAQQYTL